MVAARSEVRSEASYDQRMSVGTPVLDALETFYSAPVEEIASHLAAKLDAARARESTLAVTLDELRCAEFLNVYLTQIQEVPLNSWLDGLDESAGTVRASIVGRELSSDAETRRRSMVIDGEHLGGDGLPLRGLPPVQVKAALCYANDVTVEDPFDEEQILGDFHHRRRRRHASCADSDRTGSSALRLDP